MKLCIVIQSDAFRTSAGMRIRYDRFRECLPAADVTIDAVVAADLAASPTLDHDVYVFCKTFDTAALLLARRIRAAGKIVAQDLFDDYFSQHDDPRLQRFRQWLADMAPVTHYAVCSTPRMVDVLRAYMPDIRITAIDDPIIGFDAARVAALAASKAERARATARIDIVWFGIGDNPYFPVGLHDLVACEPALASLERLGWEVSLRIVTNKRAVDQGGARLLRQLSVAYELVEWTEEAEAQALEQATLAILPVSGQSFSQAKSMNRAVTALGGGCQVLSIGFPLYERVGDFIYRSVEQFTADLVENRMRVSPATIDALRTRLSEIANPSEAARSFAAEARRAMAAAPRKRPAPPIVCLLHGRVSTFALHKTVSALKGLSVATPFSKATWNFPVRFDLVARTLTMRTTPALANRFSLPLTPDAVLTIRDLEVVTIDTGALGLAPLPIHVTLASLPSDDLALYEDVMRFATDACRAAFPRADILISDTSPSRPARSILDADHSARDLWTAVAEPTSDRTEAGPVGAGARTGTRRPARPLLARVIGGKAAVEQERSLRLIAASGLFDRDWYLAAYPDVASCGTDADKHYLEHGWREGRDPGPHFSTKAYLKANPDVAAQGLNPLLHYAGYGEAEGRRIRPSLRQRATTLSAD